LPWCAAGAEWTLTLVDPPADLNLYVTIVFNHLVVQVDPINFWGDK
jgi:hypothetical protein